MDLKFLIFQKTNYKVKMGFKEGAIKNGGLLILFAMINGMHDGWGYIEPYIASYLRLANPNITTSMVHILYTIILSTSVISSFIFRKIILTIGYKEGIIVTFVSLGLGLLICYFSTSIILMALGFVFIGCGITVQYLISGFLMMYCMPDNMALASGLSTAGHALSPIYWGFIGLEILNPMNVQPEYEINEGGRLVKYFGQDISDNAPLFFLVNSIIMFISAFLLSPLLSNPRDIEQISLKELQKSITEGSMSPSLKDKIQTNVKRFTELQEKVTKCEVIAFVNNNKDLDVNRVSTKIDPETDPKELQKIEDF